MCIGILSHLSLQNEDVKGDLLVSRFECTMRNECENVSIVVSRPPLSIEEEVVNVPPVEL